MNRLIIIGAGGHGRVVADIARCCGYDNISFLDDRPDISVIGKVSDYGIYKESSVFVIAIGDNGFRSELQTRMLSEGCEFATIIHPSAVLGGDVCIGQGSVVMPGVVINNGATVGNGVILNTCCSVDHDCVINDFCHISVGAHIAGTVNIGFCTMIGAGATVINNIDICDDCVIGAGAVVVKDITDSAVYVGIPANRIK